MFAAGKAVSGAAPTDAQFNYVTMLLHGDGTNGAQNNTFLDSSTNNFTITRNGNTTQGTFSPYGSNWSNYFDGSGDFLDLADNAAFQFGSGDFTYECWVFPTKAYGSTVAQGLISYGVPNAFNNTYTVNLQLNPTTGYAELNVGYTTIVTGTSQVPLNQWTHIVGCRTSGRTSVFVNGVREATSTTSVTLTTAGGAILRLGGQWFANAADRQLGGYLSNARVIKGTGPYDAASTTITVPTTPLTAITNTSLLTCQSNRFIDNSTNAFAITVNGNTSVQRFSPFSPTSAYSTSVIGGSGYFDGSDNLTVSSSAGVTGTGAFTVEFWVYMTASQSFARIVSGAANQFTIDLSSNGVINYGKSSVNNIISSNAGAVLNTWCHIVIARSSGGTARMWANGVSVGTATDSNDYSAATVYIGSTSISNFYLTGYLSNLRITNTDVYGTSNTTITVPTAPLTAVSGTALLLSTTNAGIFDNAMMNDLETVGNAQISTSVKKYGTGSLYFDGSGDYLDSTGGTVNALGSGDWTIEFWVYFNALTGTNIIDYRSASVLSNTLCVNYSSGMQLFVNNSTTAIQGSSLSTSTWYHIAVCKSGSSTKMFVNGTQAGSTYTDTNNYVAGANRPRMGSGGDSAGNYLNGYIDDLRITKGFARYTSNFTAPTTAFPDRG
jgi:hypothetical protein